MNRFYGSMFDAIYPRLPVPVQNLACSYGGWTRYRARYTRHFHDTLARWSAPTTADALVALQRERLDALLDDARRNVPHYRDLPAPSSRRDPTEAIAETLGQSPVLEKQAYRDDPDAFLSSAIPRSRLKRGRTSGTTGTALPLWYTPETLAEEYATVWRMRRRAGTTFDDPHLSIGGQSIVPIGVSEPPFWRTNHYSGQTLFSIYHMTPSNLAAYVDAVHSLPGRYVQGYPSAIHQVARALLDAARPVAPGRFAAVFTSSESLLAFQREDIEAAFGAPVMDRYGVSEFAVSMTECDKGRLHVDMEFGIVEVDTVEEDDDCERGPLLVTGLSQRATPFLRYRIGDVGSKAKSACPCGRPGDSFLDVDGRIEDYVATPDGRLVGRMDHAFKDQLDVVEAQILQRDARAIEVRVVAGDGYDQASERDLLRELRARLGAEIEIAIEQVESIPREPNGKFRAVKSIEGRIGQ